MVDFYHLKFSLAFLFQAKSIGDIWKSVNFLPGFMFPLVGFERKTHLEECKRDTHFKTEKI